MFVLFKNIPLINKQKQLSYLIKLFPKNIFSSNMNKGYFKVEKNNKDVYLTPHEGYEKVLIWMHGLGDTAMGYTDLFIQARPLPDKIKVVLLTADTCPVTINGGMMMPSWYDIKSLDRHENSVEESDVLKNGERIKKVIEKEAKILNGDYKKIIVGGFSQGGCMAFHVGLTIDKKIGGILCLSGILFPFSFKNVSEDKKDIPIFIGHGNYDTLISKLFAEMSHKTLVNGGFKNVKVAFYDEEHTVSFEELDDVKSFIDKFI
jgi:phospholipase/carboxylesterase